MLNWIRQRRNARKVATDLYGSIVAQARHPSFYRHFAVSDTAEKRYELIVLHVSLVLAGLRLDEKVPAGADVELVEAFVRDFDDSMRQMTIGDTGVAKRVKRAAGGLYDRDLVYRAAFAETQEGELKSLIRELLYDDQDQAPYAAATHYAMAAHVSIAEQASAGTMATGVVRFPDPQAYAEKDQG